MTLILLAYLGGILTIVSPCILPVLPFVFARGGRPFLTGTLPLLAGMVVMFAAVASLAAVGGGWAVSANQYGRIAAMVLLTLFAVTLLSRTLADRLTRPLVALGDRLSGEAGAQTGVGSSFLLGIATGLLWAPCAGPILGLLLTGAAIGGASVQTTLLLFAYAAGAATSLALALLVGGRIFAAMKQSLGAGEWVRRALGVAVLAGVAAIAFGLDTGFLARVSLANTTRFEQGLIDRFRPTQAVKTIAVAGSSLPIEGTMPELSGATGWLNTPPLTREALRGKVVLVDFWTYSCINCLRALPYIRAWAEKYKDHGLVVLGVHAPEFAFEKDPGQCEEGGGGSGRHLSGGARFQSRHLAGLQQSILAGALFHRWRRPHPRPSFRRRRLRCVGAHHPDLAEGSGQQGCAGRHRQSRWQGRAGRRRCQRHGIAGNLSGLWARRRISPPARRHRTSPPATRRRIRWAPTNGALRDAGPSARKNPSARAAGGKITFFFHARDLHLVLGPAAGNKPVRFKVTLNGQPPGAAHGADTDEAGNGTVTGQRLYQLIRQRRADFQPDIHHRIPGSGRGGLFFYIRMTVFWRATHIWQLSFAAFA